MKEIKINNYTYTFVDTVSGCKSVWPDFDPPHLFLTYDFLLVAEHYAPSTLKPYFAIISDDRGPFGFMAFEVNAISMYESLKYNLSKPQKGFYNKLKNQIRTLLAKSVSFKALVSGNSMATGEYAFHFEKDRAINLSEVIASVHQQLLIYLKSIGEKCLGVYMKDFFPETFDQLRPLMKDHNYTSFSVQPNMIFTKKDVWTNVEDYQAALTSKYRVRNKRARKKATPLQVHELSEASVEQHLESINKAYQCIATEVDFNLFILHQEYFLALKKQFKENFKVVGYFEEGTLIGFYTYFVWHDLIEAHFLGCLPEPNRKYHAYHNFLLDLVEACLKHNKKELILSRTALEIKSSIGAKPFEMHGLIKHRKKWGQWLTPKIFDRLDPGVKWTPRNPFKS